MDRSIFQLRHEVQIGLQLGAAARDDLGGAFQLGGALEHALRLLHRRALRVQGDAQHLAAVPLHVHLQRLLTRLHGITQRQQPLGLRAQRLRLAGRRFVRGQRLQLARGRAAAPGAPGSRPVHARRRTRPVAWDCSGVRLILMRPGEIPFQRLAHGGAGVQLAAEMQRVGAEAHNCLARPARCPAASRPRAPATTVLAAPAPRPSVCASRAAASVLPVARQAISRACVGLTPATCATTAFHSGPSVAVTAASRS